MTNTPGDDPNEQQQPPQSPPPPAGGPGYWEQQAQQPPPPPYAPYSQPAPGHQPYYGAPQYYAAPDHPKATTAMVLGIVSVVCCQLTGPFAWVIGSNAVKEIDASRGQLGGRGQAMAGKVLGIIGTVLLVLAVLYVIVIIGLGVSGAFDQPITYQDTQGL